MSTKEIVNFKSNDLFKLLMVGYAGIFIPVSIISGVLSLFEILPSVLNKTEYYGMKGLIVALFTAPIYLFLMAGVTWFFITIGLKFSRVAYNLFKRD